VNTVTPHNSKSDRRLLRLFAFAVVAVIGFVVGASYDYLEARLRRLFFATERLASPVLEQARALSRPATTTPDGGGNIASPPVDRSAIQDPPRREPRAEEARKKTIEDDRAAILAECQRAAGGDWAHWQAATNGYRAALKAEIDLLKSHGKSEFNSEADLNALAGRQDFPLFEISPRVNLNYLYDSGSLDSFRKTRSVVAAREWLRQRGIDLIVVPVPLMTEVYVEHFLDPCPPDGVIAPHVRQALLELLEADVEVVDLQRLFRGLRDDGDPEYLYNTCDTHWAPRGMRAAAKEIADRIARYRFGSRARLAPPIFRTAPGVYQFNGYIARIDSLEGWSALTPVQQERARRAQATYWPRVLTLDGEPLSEDPKSPVLVIGHSYVRMFDEQLARELNLRIRVRLAEGQTTSFFWDFLREPEILKGCRVVVWVTTEQHMTHFQSMPPPIMAVLSSAK
jgi:hypothetical protein